MASFFECASGALAMGIVLLDVFLTVLYARIGTGLITERAAHLTWIAFRPVAETAGVRRGVVLSFCGPVILRLYVLLWAGGLTLGAGLIIYPGLGTGVQAGSGPTPTDFPTALYAGGSSMAIIGASDFRPMGRVAHRGTAVLLPRSGLPMPDHRRGTRQPPRAERQFLARSRAVR